MGNRSTLVEEHWVAIVGYPNYEVSNFGRVCNVTTGKDLAQLVSSKQFFFVTLHKNGDRRQRYVHRLVAEAFFTDYASDVFVTHINENRSDNTVRNLTLSRGLYNRKSIKVVETGQIFKSVSACSAALGLSRTSISRCIDPKSPYTSVKGYSFEAAS